MITFADDHISLVLVASLKQFLILEHNTRRGANGANFHLDFHVIDILLQDDELWVQLSQRFLQNFVPFGQHFLWDVILTCYWAVCFILVFLYAYFLQVFELGHPVDFLAHRLDIQLHVEQLFGDIAVTIQTGHALPEFCD